jgi:hypothetical protein
VLRERTQSLNDIPRSSLIQHVLSCSCRCQPRTVREVVVVAVAVAVDLAVMADLCEHAQVRETVNVLYVGVMLLMQRKTK